MTRRTLSVGAELARSAEAAEKRQERLKRRVVKRARRQAKPTRVRLDAAAEARVDGSTA